MREKLEYFNGKTMAETTALLGPPDSTSDTGRGRAVWAYSRRSYDPAVGPGKPDGLMHVHFENNQVVRLVFAN